MITTTESTNYLKEEQRNDKNNVMSIIVYNKSLSKESCRNTKEKSRIKNKTWAPEKKPTNFLLPTKVASVPTITPEPVLH